MPAAESFETLYLAGLQAAERGDLQAADQWLSRATARQPGSADALRNHGVVLRRLGRREAALSRYDAALAAAPGSADTLTARANLLNDLRRFEEALADADTALAQAASPVAANARGNALAGLGRTREAVESYRAAAALAAGYAEPRVNLGAALLARGEPAAALATCDEALAIAPELAAAWMGRGHALSALRRWAEADAAYARARYLDPRQPYLAGQQLHGRMKVCDWTDLDAALAELRQGLAQRQPVSVPFPLLALPFDAAELKTAAEVYAEASFGPQPRAAPAFPRPAAAERLRLAYVSADLHDHATAHLIAELIEHHDRARFEVMAFSYGPPSRDAMRQRLRNAFDRFFEVGGLDDPAVADMARGLGVDIAIDLKGYTAGARPGIFAARAAPVQVNWLGFPGTMGVGFMDYLIADPVLIPPDARDHYVEKIAWLGGSYQPNDRQRPCPPRTTRRADHGLPADGFVFGAFNNPYKILPEMFAAWMRILRAVPGSVLWLFSDNEAAAGNLRAAATAAGIDPARLVFAGLVPRERHLERHRHMDLFLDTAPCNAHTTASDALWMEVPLVTWRRETFAARVAASLLTAAGLTELIAGTLADYEALAVALARDAGRMAGFRARLAQGKATCRLFDTPRFAKDLEGLYAAMHARRLAGLAPDHMGPA
ncbi:MAG: hypothetical protein JF588_01220 [Caulobacterales bacterium]|nr:hypothetical protein [Caulobacterales bacterium]